MSSSATDGDADISATATTDSDSVTDRSSTSEAIQGASTGSVGPNNVRQTMPFPEHMEQTIALLEEANCFKYESGYYHVYNWILSHFGDRDSDTNSCAIHEDPIRITPWPQARLNGKRSDPKSETEPDLSEYSPPRDRKKPAPTQDTQPVVDGLRRTSERVRLRLLKEAEEASVPETSVAGKRSKKDVPQGEKQSKDPEDDKARFPDFLNSIFFDSKIFGIHSLVENKRLLTLPSETEHDVIKRTKDISAAFTDLNAQILETAACAFHAYKHHTTITYLITVGYYFRTIRLERNSMPPDDFNWDMRATAKKERVQDWIDKNHPGKVHHLLNFPENNDYSVEFREYWDEALGRALEDLRKASILDKEPVLAVENLVEGINDEMEERRRELLGLDNRGNARAGPSSLR